MTERNNADPRTALRPPEPVESKLWRGEHDYWCREHPHPSLRHETIPGPCDCHMKIIAHLRAALEEQRRQLDFPGLDSPFAATMKRMIDRALSRFPHA